MVRDPVVQGRILQRGRRGGLSRAFRLAVEYAVAQHGEHGQYDQGDEDAVDYLFGLLFLLGFACLYLLLVLLVHGMDF